CVMTVVPVPPLFRQPVGCWQTACWAGIGAIRRRGLYSTRPRMADAQSSRIDVRTEALFRSLLDKLGLGEVDCMACARALLPSPFDWESCTYTTTSGQIWTWDIGCARALSRRRPQPERILIDHVELAEILVQQCRVDEQHLRHIPLEKLDEPILLAPVPDRQGYAVI